MSTAASENPLLNCPVFPRFDEIKAEHVVPATKQLIADNEKSLATLEGELTAKEYKMDVTELINKLEALGDELGRSWGAVKHMEAVKDSEPLRKAVEEVQPELVKFNLQVSQSEPIYKAFKVVKDSPTYAGLSVAQKRIVDSNLLEAELAGIALEGEKKERFNAIQQELAALSTQFSNNVLDCTKAFSIRLTTKEEVAGLPESALGLAAQNAKSKGDEGATKEDGPWLITLDAPSYLPVMKHAKDRSLREKVYKAYNTRASEGSGSRPDGGKSFDNSQVINQILALKKEKAELLGKRHYADVSTAQKMATLEDAMDLMEKLRASSFAPAEKELADLQAFAKKSAFDAELQPWDVTFYAERQLEENYAFNEEDLRPYFALPRVLDGLFSLAKRLFDVDVVKAEIQVPLWDKEVQFWQINKAGKPVSYFYLDPYARPEEKRGGAWMDECAGRSRVMAVGSDPVRLPAAHMVCNQSPPVGDKPSLMTFQEVETVFHEFGHALQHMLTTQDEGLVAGIRGVEWDAVETPSQFMENWCYDKATMDKVAVHYETGEKMPAELFEKVKAAKNYRAATMMLRQLQFAVTDLTLHSSYDPTGSASVHDLYREVAKKYQVMQPLDYDRFLCGFSHIFAGGYAAGYYSYKWAEVLSADCFGAFEEAGLADDAKVQETGRRFRDTILAKGGGQAPKEVFEEFRGRGPSPEALLRHSGLVPAVV
eukprot:CAMPEP_0181314246 /NCGR_PEP_ID=MMETSP1101-20121128/14708_1 /TAXON_ID=46948 /ORGANISM="Rhodomonas abbreviata, Strain Caron Lab Isolate" /LENGTH=710 /DNA_ID=CAMNT_0023421311 /DNA_START=337 /DNA_END=2469 /DNA_ORIENTATION=+